MLRLFGRAGMVVRARRALIEPAMALMSCGPAFLALVVEALADAGARHGLDRRQATRLVVETMAGTAAYLDANELDAAELKGRVATPGGLTEKGLARAGGGRPARVVRRRRGPRGGGVAPMTLLAAISRADVADYVYTLVLVYVVLIFIQVIVSFIPRIPYNRTLSAFLGFVADVVNPYLSCGARCSRWSASGRRRST